MKFSFKVLENSAFNSHSRSSNKILLRSLKHFELCTNYQDNKIEGKFCNAQLSLENGSSVKFLEHFFGELFLKNISELIGPVCVPKVCSNEELLFLGQKLLPNNINLTSIRCYHEKQLDSFDAFTM